MPEPDPADLRDPWFELPDPDAEGLIPLDTVDQGEARRHLRLVILALRERERWADDDPG